MGSIDNLPIAYVLYAFDKVYGTVVLIEHDNTIYMENNMIDYLANPSQCENNDVRVNLRPKLYDPNNNNKQSITFPYVTSIPVEYNGVLPYIAAHKPTKYKVENGEEIDLT